jgi:hypothetical protein
MRAFAASLLSFGLAASGIARADELFIYPAKGQSEAQQSRDKYECHEFAVKQTGFDPSDPQASAPTPAVSTPAPAQQPVGGERARGAARGAAVGAVGGAVAGDAGTGAAAGAAAGTVAGGMKKRDKRRANAQAQQQQASTAQQGQAQTDAKRADYDRARTACLEGRGYTVK